MPIEKTENFPIQKHNAPVLEYRRAANETLTKFTNEMSEILRNSIQRLDNISLKVRNCVYTIEAHGAPSHLNDIPGAQENTHKDPNPNPVVAVIEYKNSEIKIKKEPEKLKKSQAVIPKGSSIQVEKVLEKLKTKKKRRPDNVSSTGSFSSNAQRKKRHMGTVIDKDILKEQSVMHRIRETHKEFYKPSKSGRTSQEKIRDKAEMKRRKQLHLRKLLMQRSILSKQGQKIAACYLQENFDDNLWFGAKIRMNSRGNEAEKAKGKKVERIRSTSERIRLSASERRSTAERIRSTSERKTHKVLKLARKKANENFHDDSPIAEKIFSVDNKISPRINSADKKDSWCVIMETQKPRSVRYELKQNCPFAANNILDEVTLKDLEPLKAEYPRRDNLVTVDVDDTLLHKLLNDRQSLEYLVDVAPSLEQNVAPKRRHKLCRTPYTKHRHRDIENIPEEESCFDTNELETSYKSYDPLDKKTSHLLNKYILAPEGANKTFLVMPVLVQFNKEITPHFATTDQPEDRKRKCIYTDATRPDAKDILRPYIFSKDNPIEVPQHTVMTVRQNISQHQIASQSRKPKMTYNSNGHKILPEEKDTVLVRKMISYDKKYKKNSPRNSPRNLHDGKPSNSQQLVSFIVDKDKKNSVEQMYIPPSHKTPRKYPSLNFRQVNPTKIERSESTMSGMRYKMKKREQDETSSEYSQEKKSFHISAKPAPKTTNLNIEECEFSVLHEAKSKTTRKNMQRMKAENALKTTSAITKKILNKWQSLENPSIVDIAKNISKDKLGTEEKPGIDVAIRQKAEKSLEKIPVVENKPPYGAKMLEKVDFKKIVKSTFDVQNWKGGKIAEEKKVEHRDKEFREKTVGEKEIGEKKFGEKDIGEKKVDEKEVVEKKVEEKEIVEKKAEKKRAHAKKDVNNEELKNKDKKKEETDKEENKWDFGKRKTPLESKPQTISPNEKLQIRPNKSFPVTNPVPDAIFPTYMLKNAYPPRLNFATALSDSTKLGYVHQNKKEIPRVNEEIPVKDLKENNNSGSSDFVGMWMEVTDNSSLIEVKTAKVQKSVKTTTEKKTANVEDLEKQLGEETKKFCEEVDEVLKQIQEAPVIKIPKAQESFLQTATNILTTPFMQAVNKFRSEDNMEDFLNYLERPTKTAIFIFLPKHTSTVTLIPNVLCFAKYYGPTCEVKKWTDSELNIAVRKEDIKLDLKVVDSVSFPIMQDYLITDRAEEMTQFTTEDLLWDDSEASSVTGVVKEAHAKFLTCVYTIIFATIFCSLNLKYQCD